MYCADIDNTLTFNLAPGRAIPRHCRATATPTRAPFVVSSAPSIRVLSFYARRCPHVLCLLRRKAAVAPWPPRPGALVGAGVGCGVEVEAAQATVAVEVVGVVAIGLLRAHVGHGGWTRLLLLSAIYSLHRTLQACDVCPSIAERSHGVNDQSNNEPSN